MKKLDSRLHISLLMFLLGISLFVPHARIIAQVNPVFESDLFVGARNSDVLRLQQCLVFKNVFFLSPTGYYGAITEASVREFQKQNNIVSSGTAFTTGYGRVGPKTRAILSNFCPPLALQEKVATPVPVPKSAPEGNNVVFGSAEPSAVRGDVWVDVKVDNYDVAQTIQAGSSILLSWEADPRTSSSMVCTGTGSAMGATGIDAKLWNGNKSYTGIVVVRPTVSTTYTISCTDTIKGVALTHSDQVIVNVK